MLQRLLILYLFLWVAPSLVAQHTFSARIIDHENDDPLIGVTVYFPDLNIGGSTDSEGTVTIRNIPTGTHQLSISYVGYESISLRLTFPLSAEEQGQTFELHHAHDEMGEIVVNSTRSSRTFEDSPTRVELIAGEELAEKGNMKPGDIRMLLNESTGIQTQQTSATSYNSSIRIQGLDGKYTQLLRDGLPLYSGFSGGLSLMQIAPLDLKQVEVIKGASSTLYGGGAIAGLVNLITKTPGEEPELSFMFNGTSALGLDASSFYSNRFGRIGTTVFTSYNKGTAYDPADNGLTAIPEFDRFTLNPRLFVYLDNTTLNLGVNVVTEDRLGGAIEYVEGDRSSGLYFERNQTDRVSTQMQLEHQFSDEMVLTLKNSSSYYDRSIEIPEYTFAGSQFSTFSEANLSLNRDRTEWIGGLNLWTDQFDQSQGANGNPLDFTNATAGAFMQNTTPLSQKWTLETGLRVDYQTDYGLFPLPRLSLMYEPSSELTFRLGGGLGYKIPTVFSEDAERRQFQNIRPLNPDELKAERSAGGNLDMNYRLLITDELSLSTNILVFYTRINDPLVLSNSGDGFAFVQPGGFVDTEGVEVNMKWSYGHLKLFVGYTHANVERHQDGEVTDFPLVAKHRLNNVLMYEKHGNFWIGLEAYYFSPQTLGDGSKGDAYWITGLMTEKRLNSHFSVFLNFENFLDTRQTAFDTIYTGSLSNPDFRDIYAPVDGFVINGGVKINW
ncbi:MAG: TonB-dependent receptor [Bacteroidetes bacterium]|jgi:iron complex outermembrane receptor protein|nr:TonB-dependent receptor [Bacteroidota bacterium]